MTDLPQFYTPKKLADLLEVSRESIYDCLRRGDIPAIKVGEQWRVHRTVVEDLIARACGHSKAS